MTGWSRVEVEVSRDAADQEHSQTEPGSVSGDELVEHLYDELRKLARARMAHLRSGHTLQPTALVNEAYLRLVKRRNSGWKGRAHFFGAAARAMRDILVEHARMKAAQKRGGDQVRVDITVTLAGDMTVSAEELLTLHNVLDKMQHAHPRKAELVLLRYFAGLPMEEIAEVMAVSKRTLEREWRFARAWLRTHLGGN
ncbi:MAG: ECF-type sigma factor [Proteobacteria bacterium]|nr:ECF-type sigma factor [Pseudomonadota bacterium]